MKLSKDTLICLGEILAGNRDLHNREISKLQHDHVCGVVLNDWYFLFSSRLKLPLTSPPHFAAEELPNDLSTSFEINTLKMVGNDSERIVAIGLTKTRPVASLIEAWGEPPALLQEDWRRQLNELEGPKEILFFLTSDDGLLFPVPFTKHFQREDRDDRPVILDSSWKSVRWPWELEKQEFTSLDQNLGTNNLSNAERFSPSDPPSTQPQIIQTHQKNEPARKQRLPRKQSLLLVGGIITGIILIASVLATQWPAILPGKVDLARSTISSSEIDNEDGRLKSGNAKTFDQPKSTLPTESSMQMDSTTIAPDSLEETDLKKDTLDNTVELLAVSEDLANLLGLGTSGDVILSNRIVETSLGTSAPRTLGDAIEPETTGEADMPMASSADESKSDNGSNDLVPLDLVTGIERTIQLTEASIKDRIAIGQKLLSKDGSCTATLQLQEADAKPVAIVVPEGKISIVGTGTNTWTIGMEDSDPELVLHFQSKPGRRWDLFVLIGFREEKTQSPRLLAPGNAKTVVNQLIAAKQSVLRLMEQNQLARDSEIRGNADFYEQRRQLQRQERELDKALERWKVIEKLSYLVFDHAKLLVTLKRTPTN